MLEHQPTNMYLQIKQENGGGALAASPMPKSDQGNLESKKISLFQSRMSYLLWCHLLLLMEEGRCLLFMGGRRFPSETEGECGALFACDDLFFSLDSQTALK